jgi:hypothetical protein
MMIELPRLLNLAGLALGMAGVVVIFIWGPPQPDFTEGVAIGATEETVLEDGRKVSDMIEHTRHLKRVHSIMSRVGLGLIGCGFALQIVAVIVAPSP